MASTTAPSSSSSQRRGRKNLSRFLRRIRSLPLSLRKPAPPRYNKVYPRRPTPYYPPGCMGHVGGSARPSRLTSVRSPASSPSIGASCGTTTMTTPLHKPTPRRTTSVPEPLDIKQLAVALANELRIEAEEPSSDEGAVSAKAEVETDHKSGRSSSIVADLVKLSSRLEEVLVENIDEKVETKIDEEDQPARQPAAVDGEDSVPGPSRSRYPPGIEAILRDENGSRFTEHLYMEETPQARRLFDSDDLLFVRPGVRPVTPPLSPRSVSPVHQLPGHWDMRGARASAIKWRIDLKCFKARFEDGLKPYFSRWWRPRAVKELLKALECAAHDLKKLVRAYGETSRLKPAVAAVAEKLDADLNFSMQELERIYDSATKRNKSATGPLAGKELAWRKAMIAEDFSEDMDDVNRSLFKIGRQTRVIRDMLLPRDCNGELIEVCETYP